MSDIQDDELLSSRSVGWGGRRLHRPRGRPRPTHLCFLLTLPVVALMTGFGSMNQLYGTDYFLLSGAAEQLFSDVVTREQRMTLEERGWEREKMRSQIIRDRLEQHQRKQQRQVDDPSLARVLTNSSTDAATSSYSNETADSAAGDPPTIPNSGKFDWHLSPVRNKYSLSEPHRYRNDSLVVIVLSARSNFDRRAAIRETWGRRHPVYFVIGGPVLPEDNQVQTNLLLEQARHHDLMDALHPDTYSSLPYKLRFAYRWITLNLPHVDWLVKVDDDTVVRVDTLQNAFLRSFNPRIPMVIGKIIERSPVAREGKWREIDYPESHYPFWPQGSCVSP